MTVSNTLTVTRIVPNARVNAYLNAGFISVSDELSQRGSMVMQKNVITQSGVVPQTTPEFKQPYLIQSGTINRPLGKHEGDRLTKAVDMEYMGAAEFEFGALPLSLRRVQSMFQLYTLCKSEVHKCTDAEGHDYVLRIFGNFDSDAHYTIYENWLLNVMAGEVRLKETCGFEARRRGETFPKVDKSQASYSAGHDFWWDVENDVFFSFDKNFMNRIERHLKASFEYMDAAVSFGSAEVTL